VVDVVGILSESENPQAYWRKLKQRLKEEGNETVTNCHALKLLAADGKMRLTDVADTEQVFRLIQSIPSKKAEPFKLWLAKTGSERIDQTIDPELSIDLAIQNYRRLGYSENRINQRINPHCSPSRHKFPKINDIHFFKFRFVYYKFSNVFCFHIADGEIAVGEGVGYGVGYGVLFNF
jgi:hypothetical protein